MSNDRSLAVYDGTSLLGHVIGNGKRWRALDARGNPLPGEYPSMKAATAACNTSCTARADVGSDGNAP